VGVAHAAADHSHAKPPASHIAVSVRRCGPMSLAAAEVEADAKYGREVLETMKEGMRALLNMHTLEELAILCDDVGVGLEGTPSKDTRIDMLFRDVLVSCPKYHFLLSRIWEGIILEYWKSLGKEIKSYKWNIRMLVMEWWNRGREVDLKSAEFQPVYAGISTTEPTAAVLGHGCERRSPPALCDVAIVVVTTSRVRSCVRACVLHPWWCLQRVCEPAGEGGVGLDGDQGAGNGCEGVRAPNSIRARL
jgi:hypothetical protein